MCGTSSACVAGGWCCSLFDGLCSVLTQVSKYDGMENSNFPYVIRTCCAWHAFCTREALFKPTGVGDETAYPSTAAVFLAGPALHRWLRPQVMATSSSAGKCPAAVPSVMATPAPMSARVNASPATVIVGATRQVDSISSQAGEMLLGAVHGSVGSQSAQLQGLTVTAFTAVPVPVLPGPVE
jgi:hypothetical protein